MRTECRFVMHGRLFFNLQAWNDTLEVVCVQREEQVPRNELFDPCKTAIAMYIDTNSLARVLVQIMPLRIPICPVHAKRTIAATAARRQLPSQNAFKPLAIQHHMSCMDYNCARNSSAQHG